MELTDYFDIGEIISAELPHENETEKEYYQCEVKKIKDELLGLSFFSPPAFQESFPANTPLILTTVKKENQNLRLSFTVRSNRTFPIIVMKFKEFLESISTRENSNDEFDEIKSEKINLDNINNGKVVERNSARVKDRFLIKYELLSNETVETIKDDYILKPTRLRGNESSATSDLQVLNKQENLSSISHIDPAVIDIIKDIYFRIHMMASFFQASGIHADDKENTGLCVDISGTGLKFLTSEQHSVGNILRMVISPSYANPLFSVSLLGEIKRVEKIESPDIQQPYKYSEGINYFAIHEDDMEEITRYTFQLQQEYLRQRRIKEGL